MKISAFYSVLILVLLFVPAAMNCYVVSDDGEVVHGVNQQGFDYYLNKQAGTVEFYDVPKEEQNENIDTYYKYKVPDGTDAATQLDYLQFSESNPFANNSNATTSYWRPNINHQPEGIEAKTPWFSILFIGLMLAAWVLKIFWHYSR